VVRVAHLFCVVLFVLFVFILFLVSCVHNVGVLQGDNLHPNLLNVFINDVVKSFDVSCNPVILGSRSVNSLLYADELLLISETDFGLQNYEQSILLLLNMRS
jgi:hypothetical protein